MKKRLAISYKLLAGSGRGLPRRSDSSFIPHPSSFRGAFSLLELMIAIVILGIGMVMVATIFPIGIDLAAQTVQMNIAQSVADAAIPTLKLKVPTSSEFGGLPTTTSRIVMAADVRATDMDIQITQEDSDVLTRLNGRQGDASNAPPYDRWIAQYGVYGAGDNVNTWQRTRFFTETTGWTGESGPDAWEYTYVIPSQNLPPAYMNPPSPYVPNDVRGLPPLFPPTLGQMPDVYPLNLVDQVYPPVPLTWLNPVSKDDETRPFHDVLSDLAGRRYSWIAIHHCTDPNLGGSRFVVTLLVTHRSNLANRYARQQGATGAPSPPYDPVFNTDEEQLLLRVPAPDLGQFDMLFPQPWLVRFKQVNIGTGEIRCTPAVASLLPPGSYFVVARTMYRCDAVGDPISAAVLTAGTAYEVLGRQAGSTDWTLQIRRQQPASGALPWTPPNANNPKAREIPYAWVVPPAIERSGNTYTFQAKSPVAGVFMRMVQQ